MTWLILPSNKEAQLKALNDTHSDRKCVPITTADGVKLLSDDKISDSYWSDYHAFLSSLSTFNSTPVFPSDTSEG